MAAENIPLPSAKWNALTQENVSLLDEWSSGMTDKQFRKMLDLECIFYGTKALIFSLPIGILLSYLINKGFMGTVSFAYIFPWKAILISIIAVYVIVYITMKYARKKVEKENIVDVLRTENI